MPKFIKFIYTLTVQKVFTIGLIVLVAIGIIAFFTTEKTDSIQPAVETSKVSCCTISDSIVASITSKDGATYEVKNGKSIKYEMIAYTIKNTSNDCEFSGSIRFDGSALLDTYVDIKIPPGGAIALKPKLKNDNYKYSVIGEMINTNKP